MNCSTSDVALNTGFHFVVTGAVQDLVALRCPVRSACMEHLLPSRPSASGNVTSQYWLSAVNCSAGFGGTLCSKCEPGYKMGPTRTCTPCTTGSSLWSPLLLIPVALALMYITLRKLLAHRYMRRKNKVDAAKKLFEQMGETGSSSLARTSTGTSMGTLSRQQLRSAIAKHGHVVSDDVAIDIVESIDIDFSNSIDQCNTKAILTIV